MFLQIEVSDVKAVMSIFLNKTVLTHRFFDGWVIGYNREDESFFLFNEIELYTSEEEGLKMLREFFRLSDNCYLNNCIAEVIY